MILDLAPSFICQFDNFLGNVTVPLLFRFRFVNKD